MSAEDAAQNPAVDEIQSQREGTMDQEELISRRQRSAKPENPQAGEESGQLSEYQEKIAAYVAQAYVMRTEFTGRLDELIRQAKSEYWKLPRKKRTSFAAMGIVARYIPKAAALEKEGDAAIEQLISEMTELCREYGIEDPIVRRVRASYAEQKSSTIASCYAKLKSLK